MRKSLFALLLGSLLLQATPSIADMVLNKVVIDFPGNKVPRDDIKIQNTGNDTLFVLVEPQMVVNPGTEAQKRQKMRDPKKFGLLVTPNRFVLQPKQTKVMRLVVLNPAEKEDRVYRLTVKPVIGKVEAAQTAVKIVIGYDVLVIVRPPGSKANLQHKRDGKSVWFSNNGTTSVLLSNGKNCDESGDNCVDIPPKRLYVGNEWKVDLKYDTPLEYYVTVREDIKRLQF